MQKPTITDIANRLGITPSTVSRALAGSPRVKPSTREAVEAVAAEMGYERNVLAANLRKGTASIVGIIVPRINREIFANIISSAEEVLNEAGYSVITCQTKESVEQELRAFQALRRNQVAAVMVSHALDAPGSQTLETINNMGVPVIQFDRVDEQIPGAKVVSDNVGGAYAATRQLIAAGYKKVGTLAGPQSVSIFRERLEGYRKALREYGLDPNGYVYPEGILRESGREAAFKAMADGCDALYCAGDYSALGAMDAVRDAGLRIPEDFGIVGTANEAFTSLTSPSLSSLSQHPKEIGRAIAEAFLKGDTSRTVIPMDLIIRQSSSR